MTKRMKDPKGIQLMDDTPSYEDYLEELYNSDTTLDDVSLPLLKAGLDLDEDELAEKSLFLLYRYFSRHPVDELKTYLLDFCRNPEREGKEKLRGRKYWVTILLSSREEALKIAEKVLQQEQSEYGRNRVLAAFSNRDFFYKIYPVVGNRSLKGLFKDESDSFRIFSSRVEEKYDLSFSRVNHYNENILEYTEMVLLGTLDVSQIRFLYQTPGKYNASFPLSPEDFQRLFLQSSGQSSRIMLYLLGIYLGASNPEKGREVLNLLLSADLMGSVSRDPYVCLLFAQFQAWTAVNRQDADQAVRSLHQLLILPLEEKYRIPRVSYEIGNIVTTHLGYLLQQDKTDSLDFEILKQALNGHPFMAQAAASVLRIASLKGWDISNMREDIEKRIELNPETSHLFGKGSDIAPMESLEKGISHWTLFNPEDQENEEEAMMNLNNLTAALEMMAPASTTVMLKESLKSISSATLQVPEDFLGPMPLVELCEAVEEKREAGVLSQERFTQKRNEITEERRSSIKSIFEEERSGSRPFSAILRVLQISNLTPLNWGSSLPDGNMEALAQYQTLSSRKGLNSRHGIYFHSSRILALLENHQEIPSDVLILTVAVHELFHYFTEAQLGREQRLAQPYGPVNRNLEEAAANFVAREWARQSYPEYIPALDTIFFNTSLPGYGEWSCLDRDILHLIGPMIQSGEGIEPGDYKKNKKMNLLNFNLQNGAALWASLIDNMKKEEIPYYLDLSV